MQKNEKYSILEGFYVLLNHKTAAPILSLIRQKTEEQAKGTRWKEIFGYACQTGISKSEGTIKETLEKLVDDGLVKLNAAEYTITLKGCWVLGQYEKILKGPQLETIPELVQNLMATHGWNTLLPAQREFIEKHFPPKNNLSILAPPSAGKTFMAECCISEKLKGNHKVIYITPYKALNRQKHELFETIFGKHLKFKVSRTDGDTLTPPRILSKSDIVVSTYERALGGILKNEEWINNASLTIADEITLLNDQERGANLDILLSLLKEKMQVITLSSNVGNPDALRNWHGGDIFEYPQDEYIREFIVKQVMNHVVIEDKNGTMHSDKQTSTIELIFEHMNRKPDETVLILVGPRAKAESLSLEVSRHVNSSHGDLAREVQLVSDEVTPLVKRLSKVLEKGVVFHHAGIRMEIRDFIEDLLNKRIIHTVVATTTLSHGVDFPIDYVVIFLDTFEFKKRIDDRLIAFPGLSKLEYLQYSGRAARFGKSKKGDVYVVSDEIPTRTIDQIRRNFLGKKVEGLRPSTLTEENIDWIVLSVSKNMCPTSKEKLTSASFDFIRKLLYFQTLEKKAKNPDNWEKRIEQSIERLDKYGFLKVSKKLENITDLGLKVAEVNMTPHDSLFVIKNLQVIEKLYDRIDDPTRHLVAVVCGIGLLRNFDGIRIESIVTAYRLYCKTHKKIPPLSIFQLKCEAKAWILSDWMSEKSLSYITSEPALRRIVYDDDIPRLGHYASMEMRKIVSLAKILRLEKVTKLAEDLVTRLNKGIKLDLMNNNPDVDLFRLESIGRRKARILHNHGYKTLLDMFSKIFSEGEEEFVKSCGLTKDEALHLLADLKILFQENEKLKELCRNL